MSPDYSNRPLAIICWVMVFVLCAVRVLMGPGQVPLDNWPMLWPQLVKDMAHVLSGFTLGAGVAVWRVGHQFWNSYTMMFTVLLVVEILVQLTRFI